MENRLSKALDQPPPSKDEIIAVLPVYAAVERLKMALMEDQDLHTTWKANIAGAFYNAAAKYTMENCMHWDENDAKVTMEIAETAAVNFINQLCTTNNSKKD